MSRRAGRCQLFGNGVPVIVLSLISPDANLQRAIRPLLQLSDLGDVFFGFYQVCTDFAATYSAHDVCIQLPAVTQDILSLDNVPHNLNPRSRSDLRYLARHWNVKPGALLAEFPADFFSFWSRLRKLVTVHRRLDWPSARSRLLEQQAKRLSRSKDHRNGVTLWLACDADAVLDDISKNGYHRPYVSPAASIEIHHHQIMSLRNRALRVLSHEYALRVAREAAGGEDVDMGAAEHRAWATTTGLPAEDAAAAAAEAVVRLDGICMTREDGGRNTEDGDGGSDGASSGEAVAGEMRVAGGGSSSCRKRSPEEAAGDTGESSAEGPSQRYQPRRRHSRAEEDWDEDNDNDQGRAAPPREMEKRAVETAVNRPAAQQPLPPATEEEHPRPSTPPPNGTHDPEGRPPGLPRRGQPLSEVAVNDTLALLAATKRPSSLLAVSNSRQAGVRQLLVDNPKAKVLLPLRLRLLLPSGDGGSCGGSGRLEAQPQSNWVLAVVDRAARSVNVFDSMATDISTAAAFACCKAFVADLPGDRDNGRDGDRGWEMRALECPQQPNACDSGLVTLAVAVLITSGNDIVRKHMDSLYLSTVNRDQDQDLDQDQQQQQQDLGNQTPFRLWRCVFATLLLGSDAAPLCKRVSPQARISLPLAPTLQQGGNIHSFVAATQQWLERVRAEAPLRLRLAGEARHLAMVCALWLHILAVEVLLAADSRADGLELERAVIGLRGGVDWGVRRHGGAGGAG
ncbi:hypothetical protein QBC33DRAFT_573497 [Phialemonium atrogriseum]|uniref:Ubiquitin-like protease family profile domain-containing protein n=1 Tax=Phialemonium atrogriseum TaxID=1093897 RepID=A0AAJ0FDM5_9PEZI|nr:uncharacterized protein QBC33DRAFT_573497 [Phialemonium atrogriseum]KAK1763407.1 hypothetical protein QBC33DRAFT_573497 [Phialemonium atrogriseum]